MYNTAAIFSPVFLDLDSEPYQWFLYLYQKVTIEYRKNVINYASIVTKYKFMIKNTAAEKVRGKKAGREKKLENKWRKMEQKRKQKMKKINVLTAKQWSCKINFKIIFPISEFILFAFLKTTI